jgi:hypothetical protein
MLTALCLVLITLFVDETFYNRHIPAAERPVPQSRWKRLVGIEQWHSRKQRSTPWQAFMRPWVVIVKPTVFLSMFYYCFTFAWVVGINTTLSIFVTPLYNFGLRQVGMLIPLLTKQVRILILEKVSSTSPPSWPLFWANFSATGSTTW